MSGKITLITGGIRSGKSSYALELARAGGHETKWFIATAEGFDEEMRSRIRNHQAERGNEFQLVEEPVDLGPAILRAVSRGGLILVDCLTVWLSNLFHYYETDERRLVECIEMFFEALRECDGEILMITNEVGFGIVPETQLGRRFTEVLGRLNRRAAKISDDVILMIAGIPMPVKGARCRIG